MKFKRVNSIAEANKSGVVYLIYNNWDDYSYCTTFTAYFKTKSELRLIELGIVKIGCLSLHEKVNAGKSINGYSSYSIKELIPSNIFFKLDEDFFSLGQDIDYYKNVNKYLCDENVQYYECIKDLAFDYDRFNELYNQREVCLINSLMRSLYKSSVEQFNRIIKGEAELTEYTFSINYQNEKIDINVTPKSLPPTNIHVLIGRNGVGKSWLLHSIACSLLESCAVDVNELEESDKYSISEKFHIDCIKESFAGIIGMSFSVFDDSLAIDIMNKNEKSEREIENFRKVYKYIGSIYKSQKDGKKKIKSVEGMANEFIEALKKIANNKNKRDNYIETCNYLNNDSMFYDNGFIKMLDDFLLKRIEENEVIKYFKRLSSGHMIIILSLTLLAESIYEKTIVLIDEPETHLHPPLLSTYIRALSFLLLKKNAVAIIATHSPIVLQEVPSSCVNKISRTGEYMQFDKISIESFATNTDSLIREVFGLEVIKTGFYQLIKQELADSFDESLDKFEGQVGFLGKVLMQSLLSKKDDNHEED